MNMDAFPAPQNEGQAEAQVEGGLNDGDRQK